MLFPKTNNTNIINIFNDKDKEYLVKNISYKLLKYDNDHIIKII